MDVVTTLRELWRRRRYVAGVFVLALIAGAAIMFHGHRYQVGVASARILVDTPSSQVVQVAPEGLRQPRRTRRPAGERDGRRGGRSRYRQPCRAKAQPTCWTVGYHYAAINLRTGAGFGSVRPARLRAQRSCFDRQCRRRAAHNRGRHSGSGPGGGCEDRRGGDRGLAGVSRLYGRRAADWSRGSLAAHWAGCAAGKC